MFVPPLQNRPLQFLIVPLSYAAEQSAVGGKCRGETYMQIQSLWQAIRRLSSAETIVKDA